MTIAARIASLVPVLPHVREQATTPSVSVSVEALAEIAAGLARIERSVPLIPHDDPTAPRSIRLIGTDAYVDRSPLTSDHPAGRGTGRTKPVRARPAEATAVPGRSGQETVDH